MRTDIELIREEMSKVIRTSPTNTSDFSSEEFENRMLGMRNTGSSDDAFAFDIEEDGVSMANNEVTSFVIGDALPIEYNTTEEVIIENIHDTHGVLSDKVDEVMLAAGCSVIPFDAAGVLHQVVDFQRHEIMTLNGIKYIMAKEIRADVIEEFKSKITETLSAGLPYKKCLNVDILVGTVSYETFALSKAEWSYVCSLFRRYGAKVIYSNQEQLVLVVGNNE